MRVDRLRVKKELQVSGVDDESRASNKDATKPISSVLLSSKLSTKVAGIPTSLDDQVGESKGGSVIEHHSKPASELSSEEKLDTADLSNRQNSLDNKTEDPSKP